MPANRVECKERMADYNAAEAMTGCVSLYHTLRLLQSVIQIQYNPLGIL